MESADAYIPMDRRQAMLRGKTISSRTNGSALFADISGFTSLTAAMVEALGPRRGAGESTRQVNLLYEALIAEVHRYRGSVIGFGGDAITCWFDGDDGLRATVCALAMQRTMGQFDAIETPAGLTASLAIKVAVATGSAQRFLVGDPAIQYLDVLAGATLDRMAAAERAAGRGEVVVGPVIAERLSDKAIIAERRQSTETSQFLAVVSELKNPVEVEVTPWSTTLPQASEAEQTTALLTETQIRPWLLPPVFERLKAGRGRFLAELRTTVTIFLRFEGLDYDRDNSANEKLDDYIRWVQNSLARYEGYLIKLTIGDKGSYLLATFGAPLAHGDDADRAVTAALELQSPPPHLEFITGTQIGLSQGRMLAGAFGSATRSAYDVLGSEANLAARLMSKAESGQVLISKRVAETAGKNYRFNYLTAVEVKGWREPIPVFEVLEKRISAPPRMASLVGRENALTQLEKILDTVSTGRGQVLHLDGVAGVGRHHLTADFVELASDRSFQVARGVCHKQELDEVSGPWRQIFRIWFDLTDEPLAGEDPVTWKVRQISQVEAIINDINPDWLTLLPILGDLLDIQIPDKTSSQILDPVLRQGILFALATEMVKAWANDQPSLLLIEDAHWLNQASRGLTMAVSRSIVNMPILLALVHRSSGQEDGPLLPDLDLLPYYNHLNLHGKTEPVMVNRPRGEGQQTVHLQLQQKIIGRKEERRMLAGRLQALLSNEEGGLIVIEGEAGIGKSRLVSHLLEQVQALGLTTLMGAGNAVESSTPYFAWRSVFSQLFDLDTRPGANTTFQRTRALSLLPTDPELLRLIPLLNVVLPLGLQESDVTSQMTGRERSNNTLRLLVDLLQAAVAQSPTILILEDAQWLDSASWALIRLVIQRVQPVLLIIVTRPLGESLPAEFQEMLKASVTHRLQLDALPADDTIKLVCQRLGVETLPEPVEALIREKAEGHPLFSEELAFALRDTGLIRIINGECRIASHVEDLSTVAIPDIIEGLITSRIDRLTPAQQLTLKVASVIGRVCSVSVLQDIHPIEADRPKVVSHLEAIEQLDIIRLETPEPDLTSVFKNSIIQEVVYALLPITQQQDLHRDVAEWYKRSYSEELVPFYPLLAYHYERAGKIEAAITYLWQAGQHAIQVGGYQDALNLLHYALDLLMTIPETDETGRQELNILVPLGAALIATKGQGAPEVKRNYDRARALCQKNGETPELAQVLFGLTTYHFFRGELGMALVLAKQCLNLAQETQDSTLGIQAHLTLGNTYFWLGNFLKNQYYAEQVIRLYDPDHHQTQSILYAQNPRITCLTCSTWGLCIMGYPERALARSQEALALAESLDHPFSMGIAIQISAWLHQHLREYTKTRVQAEKLIELTAKVGFPIYHSLGLALHGWASAHQGQATNGITEINEGIEAIGKAGTQLGSTYFSVLLAEAYQQANLVDEGLAVVTKALNDTGKSEEASYKAELYRLKAELLLAKKAEQAYPEAVAAFSQSISIAGQQQAKLFELRAVIGLSRLWQQQGKYIEAHAQLAVMFNQFTEGLATSELQAAAALIAELST